MGGINSRWHNKGDKWYQVLHPTVAVPTQYDQFRSPPNKDPVTGKDSHLICIKDGNGDIPETYGNLMGAPGLTHKIVIKRANKGIQVDIVHAPSGKSMLYGGIFLKPDNFDFKPEALPFCFYNANFETTFMSVQSTGVVAAPTTALSLDFSNHEAVKAAFLGNKLVAHSKITATDRSCPSGQTAFWCQNNGASTDGYDYCGDNTLCPANVLQSKWDANVNQPGDRVDGNCCHCGVCLSYNM
jgi:hypothetical protein